MIHKLTGSPDLQLSEQLVYRGLVQFGELTKNEIARKTGGSQSSVYRILCALVEQGLVIQSVIPTGGNGRRPIKYRINPDAGYLFGSYLRWDVFGVGLCSIDGSVLAKRQRVLGLDMTPSDLVASLKDDVESLLSENGVDRTKIIGLSFATVGPLLKDKGILYHPYHIERPNWDVVPIRDMLEMATRFPVVVNNLACAALLGELVNREGGLFTRSSYVLLDEGVGTDTFIPGAADRTMDDQSGTLGGMIIDVRNPRGILANYVSLAAIYSRFKDAFPETVSLHEKEWAEKRGDLWEGDARLYAVEQTIARCSGNDALRCAEIMEDVSLALSAGISNHVGLLNPRVVYYGGRVADRFPETIRMAIEKAKSNRPVGILSDIDYVESRLDDELLIRGGVYQILEERIGLFRPVAV